jgi:hypothetical protein
VRGRRPTDRKKRIGPVGVSNNRFGGQVRTGSELPQAVEEFATGSRVDHALSPRCWLFGLGPPARLGLWALAGHLRRRRVFHAGLLADVDSLDVVAELNWNAVGVEAVDRMYEAVVYDVGDPKLGGFQFRLQLLDVWRGASPSR